LVTLTTNQGGARTEPGSVWYVGDRELVVEHARPQQTRFIVQFAGVVGRDAAEALRSLVVTADALGDAPEGEMWVHELIGAEVCDPTGTSLGRVVAVEANPAHDLLVLEDGGLVPMVFVVDRGPGRLVVELPPGLLDE
jgi:16S rRNA processing protein RimM